MKREKIKTPRGTARKLRRADITVFKAEREKRRSKEFSAGTHTVNWAGPQGRSPERNPHFHSVATVTDLRNGQYVVRQYDWTNDYPANVPAPLRHEIGARQYFDTYGSAKEVSDEINRIMVPEPRPLRRVAA